MSDLIGWVARVSTIKQQNKQVFTTFDSFTVLSLVVGVIVLVGSIVSNAMVDQKLKFAKERSGQLAAQILAGGYRGLESQALAEYSNRSPASKDLDLSPEGRIGMDPWGSSYYYKLSEISDGRVQVIVLSSGPNRIRESFENQSEDDGRASGQGLRLGGDDIASSIVQ